MKLPRINSLIILNEKEVLDKKIALFLRSDEKIILSCRNIVDKIVFTDSRLIILKQYGLFSKRKDIYSLYYNKIHAFAFFTSEQFALQHHISITFDGVDTLRVGFFRTQNLAPIITILSDNTNFY